MAKQISRKDNLLALQAKEGIDKINSMALSETVDIKAEFQTTIFMVKNIDQDHRSTMYSLKKELEIIRSVMLNMPSL